jgi:hypothetical protein
MTVLHEKMTRAGVGGWREIGKLIGVSGAYARMLAQETRPLTPKLVALWLRNAASLNSN